VIVESNPESAHLAGGLRRPPPTTLAPAIGRSGVVAAAIECQDAPVADGAATDLPASSGVIPSAGCGCGCSGGKKSNIFALGLISFDFGTEARRDSFRQLMPPVGGNPANPYNAPELCDYLDANPWESTKLFWILNLDSTPIYAVEPESPYAEDFYKALRKTLRGESLAPNDADYVGRVSVSGTLTGRTIQLFSGQTVPVLAAQFRGFYAWNESSLFAAVKQSLPAPPAGLNPAVVDLYLRNFLSKVYYEFRNLGQNSSDRALNYAATNLFQIGSALSGIINPKALIPNIADATLYAFDTISVSKSPYCRVDSDCWDVQLTFFNPNNAMSATLVVQFTVDVSDTMPVSVGSLRAWTSSPD
jgi:cyanobactin maturation PatA/PatG family protease